MTSPNAPRCNCCGRDDQMIWTEYVPASREHRELRSASSLYPVGLQTTHVEAGVRFRCRCGNESIVAAPEGWLPEE